MIDLVFDFKNNKKAPLTAIKRSFLKQGIQFLLVLRRQLPRLNIINDIIHLFPAPHRSQCFHIFQSQLG
jgi:hypothetical protein